MEDSKRRRRLLQHILMGWVVVTGAMPMTGNAANNSLVIREPVAAPSFLPVREPQISAATAPDSDRKPRATRPTISEPPSLTVTAQGASPQSTPQATASTSRSLPPLPTESVASAVAAPFTRSEPAAEAASLDHAQWLRKLSLARQVSGEILGAATTRTTAPPAPNVSTMTARRLAQQAAEQLAQARGQVARGTLLSAAGSAFETLRLIADANDLLTGNVSSATALQRARTALRESKDFAGRFGPVGPEAIARMAASHQTTILKDCDTSALNGSRATDIYLDFARSQFAEVAEANPIAIEALVVLAQVQRRSETPGPLSDATVISLLRAAIQAGPNDPVVANELGFQLLKQGLLEEAQWALEHSYRLQPSRSAGVNLAETLRQRGDLRGAQAMIASLQQIPPTPARQPQVFALSPQQFAALSQRTAPPQNQLAPSAAATPAATLQPTPAAPVQPAAPLQPAEPKSPLGRVADAVSHLWK